MFCPQVKRLFEVRDRGCYTNILSYFNDESENIYRQVWRQHQMVNLSQLLEPINSQFRSLGIPEPITRDTL